MHTFARVLYHHEGAPARGHKHEQRAARDTLCPSQPGCKLYMHQLWRPLSPCGRQQPAGHPHPMWSPAALASLQAGKDLVLVEQSWYGFSLLHPAPEHVQTSQPP